MCEHTKEKKILNSTLCDDEGKEEIDYDEGDETENTMKDNTLHGIENCIDHDESIYNDENDEEATFE